MADLTSMVDNLGSSIAPMMRLVSGFCYAFGFWMAYLSIKKLKDMADLRARQTGGGRTFIPLVYGLGSVVFIFLPTFVQIGQNTLFGASSPLEYADWLVELKAKYGNSVYVITQLIQFAGLLWFVRGTFLLVQASEPGVQHGPKGMGFLLAGIFALNIKYTANAVSYLMSAFARLTM